MINAALKGDQLTRQIENKPNGYMALATRAAEFEREGRYITASTCGPWPARPPRTPSIVSGPPCVQTCA